jgi:hypothetical protein
MKNIPMLLLTLLALPAFSCPCAALDPVVGVIAPLNNERVTITQGDKAVVNVGERDGIVKGDVGSVGTDKGGAPSTLIARCAVTAGNYRSSVCEVINDKKEIDPGSFIFFDPVAFTDATLYPVTIAVLSHVVDPYEPYKRLRVCLYGIFNDGNAQTGLSELIMGEFARVFAQKKRIDLVDKSALKELIFYPDADEKLIEFVQKKMKSADMDALLTGTYRVSGKRINLTVLAINKQGSSKTGFFSFPLEEKYTSPLSTVAAGPVEPTRIEVSTCLLRLKTMPFEPARHELGLLIGREAAGNPLVERVLKQTVFNLLGPVEITVKVDDEVMALSDKKEQRLALPKGVHRVMISFKRGYFFNESLLYTSQQEVTREALLDLTRPDDLLIDIRINPLFQPDAISLDVGERVDSRREIIKPICKVQSERTIDVFRN